MTPFAWGLLIGLVVVLSLLVAAKRGDQHLDPTSRRQAADEERVWHNVNRKEEPHGQDPN